MERFGAASGATPRWQKTHICTCKCTIIELLCSFALPQLLKSALVLVHLVLLVLLVVVVVVVVVGVVVVVVVVVVVHATPLIFAFLRAIGGVFALF